MRRTSHIDLRSWLSEFSSSCAIRLTRRPDISGIRGSALVSPCAKCSSSKPAFRLLFSCVAPLASLSGTEPLARYYLQNFDRLVLTRSPVVIARMRKGGLSRSIGVLLFSRSESVGVYKRRSTADRPAATLECGRLLSTSAPDCAASLIAQSRSPAPLGLLSN